jgi:hypothetical protein
VTAVLPWIVAYLAILLVWALIVLRRSGPTLWKGRSLVALNIAFVLGSTALILLRGESVAPGLIALDVILVIVALVMREKWFLLGISHADSTAVLERCFVQTRAASVRRDDGYAVECGELEMWVSMRPASIRVVRVRFSGASGSKKAALVRSLFGKQFHNSFPTPRLRA